MKNSKFLFFKLKPYLRVISVSFLTILFCQVFINGCELPADFNPPGDSFAGNITFTDTNLIISSSGYYAISIFTDSTFQSNPLKSDSLIISKVG